LISGFILCVGRFESIPLGSVYARDEDDWDVGDKTFSFATDNDAQFFGYLASSVGIYSVELLDSVWMVKRNVVRLFLRFVLLWSKQRWSTRQRRS